VDAILKKLAPELVAELVLATMAQLPPPPTTTTSAVAASPDEEIETEAVPPEVRLQITVLSFSSLLRHICIGHLYPPNSLF